MTNSKSKARKAPVRSPRASKAAPRGRALRRPRPEASDRQTAGGNSGLAPGMQSISCYLAVANPTASIEFLERAFGFTRGVVLADPEGQLRYAEMRHGTSTVVLVRKSDGATATGGSAALYAYVEDVDRAAAQARLAGAGVEEPADKPWGDRVAAVIDPDGYRWVLATFKKLAPFT